MNIAHSIPSTVSSISFSFLQSEDIRKLSVKQIVNPVLLDVLNRPNVGGLYDPALGPTDKKDICATCRLTHYACPGHFGHIELPSPIFHPLTMLTAYNILRATCMYCHRFKIKRTVLIRYIAKLRLLEHGQLDAALMIDEQFSVPMRRSGAEDADGDDEMESAEDLEKRIKAFVTIVLFRAQGATRDRYKDTLVYQARKDIISEFMKVALQKKCNRLDCGAFSHTFRKEAHTKIIEYDLTPKQKLFHRSADIKRPNVLAIELRASEKKKSSSSEGVDGGSDESEDDSEEDDEGESTFSDPETESEGDEDTAAAQEGADSLPRAANGKVKTIRGRNERIVAPEECRAHLRRLFKNETVMCSLLFGRHGPFAPVSQNGVSIASADMFFMDVLAVSPTRFRPPARMGETLFEHPQNELLTKILNTCFRLRDLNDNLRAASEKTAEVDEAARRRVMGSLLDTLVQLQVDVNSFIDSGKNPQPVRQGKLPPAGVKQVLEKKEGLFRMHMMGKRVNYAARTVISPDVNIEPNEIGVPPVFARKLTYPEPVTEHNIHEMRQLVINGPSVYPGANFVEYEDGQLMDLTLLNDDQRKAMANQLLTPQTGSSTGNRLASVRLQHMNKKVYRHLRDGDILILNRQPTLHKPSMMTHKARVLRGEKTIRMHYANCNSYNADFDGDEMNIHFPQNQVARAEGMMIANTDNQYLVPTSGKPLRGLIQDHVVAGVWMTCRDTFFEREEYFQLLYGSLRPEEEDESERLRTLSPTIWKPRPLWTGKQIISSILLNITPRSAKGLNLTSKAKVPAELWGKGSEEATVIFSGGELLCGVLDKSAFGATDYGLIHSVYELYGADVAGKLLGILSRLFTKFLQHRAFTCRMDDLTLTPTSNTQRRKIFENGRTFGTDAAMDNFPSLEGLPGNHRGPALKSFLQEVLRDDNKMAGLDMTVKQKLHKLTKSIADACMPHGLMRKFPRNHMQMMTQSGAKGSAVNAQQISCALGQQELEGRRVPVMVSGKTLPSFKAFETAAIAGGYISSRFLTGVKPQEFYFHCMAGREGLIDTAVKTSRSGYLQRCLIKHLEGIRVHYDNTVRGSDSSIYQFHYGGDSLDVTKQKHLYQFEFTARNYESLVARFKPGHIGGKVDEQAAMTYTKRLLKKAKDPNKLAMMTPTLELYSPSLHLGATSEKFALALDEYAKTNPHNLLSSKKHEVPAWMNRSMMTSERNFKSIMYVRYMRSLIEPGEAVGLLASQGVGEPSTQMTLNTFHFAGHGAANVTLGIPRLREIVMTASTKPKTPSMTLAIQPDTPASQIQAFCKLGNRLTLSQLVDTVVVQERLSKQTHRRHYTIKLKFYPKDEYTAEYSIDSEEILAAFGAKFSFLLRRELQMELKKLNADIKSHLAQLGKGKKVQRPRETNEGDEAPVGRDDDAGSEVGDGDTFAAKRAQQSQQQTSYESDEDETGPVNEFNDDEIENEYKLPAGSDEEEHVAEGGEAPLGKVSTKQQARQIFVDNLKEASAFSFSDDGASFDLDFDSEMPKLLLVGIVERTCRKTIIREVPGISDCFPVKEDKKDNYEKIVTNGSNFPGMWELTSSSGEGLVDLDSIYSNDIYACLRSYGVEMARAVILKEVQGVFGAYNIDVNLRHLELIADYMTFEGGYKPFNRKGISMNSSPLLKASFETTASFLSDATLYGDFDDLSTPSGSIVLGRPSITGTGVFDVVQSLGQ